MLIAMMRVQVFRAIPGPGAAWLAVIALATTYMTYYIMYNKEELEGVIYRLKTNSIFKSRSGWELAENISGQLWKVIDAFVRSNCKRVYRQHRSKIKIKRPRAKSPATRRDQRMVSTSNKGKSPKAQQYSHRIAAMSAIMAMSAARIKPRMIARFDSDSRPIRIDNCASFCISNEKKDFVSPLRPLNRKLKGIGGTLNNIQSGTIQWAIEDDMGRTHQIRIPNSLYVPESPSRLLSPQHWAQESNDVLPNPRGTWCATYRDSVVLHWNQRQFTRTLALDRNSSNVATLYTASSYNMYSMFCTECDGDDPTGIVALDANTISDDESDDGLRHPSRELDLTAAKQVINQEVEQSWPGGHTSTPEFDFDLDQQQPTATSVIEMDLVEEQNRKVKKDVVTEFAHLHQRLGHLPPAKIRRMAAAGFLPRRLAKCQVPACRSCLFGQATRRPWRNKPKKDATPHKLRTATQPGQCVSVDQLESSTPGLIAQMKGWLTKKRYRVATIFVDHYSGLSYVHMQKTTNAAETLEAKKAFERFALRHGVQVSQYQADNGRFAETVFLEHVRQAQQTITYCGVNAHFQNAVAERRIRVLQDRARTMLLHAKQRWPTAVEAYLWPYAIRLANEVHNATPDILRTDLKSPLELFTKSSVTPDLGHFRPFACPVYVLDNSLQQGMKIDKWEARSRMGLYLGMSMVHARSVALACTQSKHRPCFTAVSHQV
jgi:hypothetical protein